jgi:putative Holliday junction resolvase
LSQAIQKTATTVITYYYRPVLSTLQANRQIAEFFFLFFIVFITIKQMRILAIDYGSKRTGLAICDPSETICSPLAVLDSTKNLTARIIEFIKTENAEAVVIGLPLNMDDTEGPQVKSVRKFADELSKSIDIPIHFQDERLTTFAADEKLDMTDLSAGRKKQWRDAIAAADILLAFIESSSC